MRGRLLILVALLGAAATFVTAAPASAGTTIGQAAGGITCSGQFVIWQTSGSVSYTVPTGSWTITSWSTQAGAGGGQMAAVVLRPSGGGDYTVVAVSATETLTPSSLNTFAVSMPVQGGDLLGLWFTGSADCYDETGDEGDVTSYISEGKPSVGQTQTAEDNDTGYLIDISATLSPGAGAVVPQVDSVFLCYSSYEQDGGAVFPIDTAIGLLNGGYWVPSAIAGNVDGGTNVGGYHLQCNPPSDLKPTGQYVGGGGDVVDATAATNARYGYYPIVG